MNFALQSLRTFAHDHDDIPAFHAGFLVLTFVAASMFSLGAFACLIFVHMCLDILKYREVHKLSWSLTTKGVMHESLVDITLLMVGLVFSVYFHHSVLTAGVSGLLRAEITIVRALGVLIPKLKILEHFLKAIAHLNHYLETVHPHLRKDWTVIDKLYMFFILVCTGLLFLAPILMNAEPNVVRMVIMWELTPWSM